MTAASPTPGYREVDEPLAENDYPSVTGARESALLAAVAQNLGLGVSRHDPDLLTCSNGRREVIFWGMTGALSGRIAHVLAGNVVQLRHFYAVHELPVLKTSALAPGDDNYVGHAHALGLPVRLRRRMALNALEWVSPVLDAESIEDGWQAMLERSPGRRGRVVIEHVPRSGRSVELAVVGERIVAAEPESVLGERSALCERISQLGRRAIAALPAVAYGTIRLVTDDAAEGSGQPVAIDTVEPSLGGWLAIDMRKAEAIASAILELEFR